MKKIVVGEGQRKRDVQRKMVILGNLRGVKKEGKGCGEILSKG